MQVVISFRATTPEEIESVRTVGSSITYDEFKAALQPVFQRHGIPEHHFTGVDLEVNDWELD